MKCWWNRFNIYLALTLTVLFGWGCASPEKSRQKQLSTLRLHVESRGEVADRAIQVPIYRQDPVMITVERGFFLSEGNVKHAEVVSETGGFVLRIEFDRRGAWLLEQYTADNRGRHLVILSQFANPENPKEKLQRWLAAPLITQRVTNGILVFTPDTTRAEAEQIAIGLNNVAKKADSEEAKV